MEKQLGIEAQEILDLIRKNQAHFQSEGVQRMRLFGSVARNDGDDESDVDLSVAFDQELFEEGFAFFARMERLKNELSDLLDKDVDLVIEPVQKKRLAEQIEKEGVVAFSKNPRLRFEDIIDNIDWIISDVGDQDRAHFMDDRKTQDAVLFSLLRISEACTKLAGLAEDLFPDIPWVHIRTVGNYLRHGYDEINLDIVWSIIQKDLPVLRQTCVDALDRLDR